MKTSHIKYNGQIARMLLVTAAAGIMMMTLAPRAAAQTVNAGIIDPTNTYEGKTYGEWSEAHWQWVYSLPVNKHPLFDTGDVSVGQTGDVWFLGGTYTTTADTNGVINAVAVRDSIIPQGKALFFPLINAESSVAEGNGTNYAQLLANSQALINGTKTLSCTIDGQTISNLTAYRAASDLFTWGPLPTNNIFEDPANFPAGASSQAVADGYYLLLEPMRPGSHVIHFTGGVPGFQLDVTYNLTVTPTNGVYPPGMTLYGKSYSDWSSAFFQYYLGQSSTNNPFWFDASHPGIPLGEGQSGPVWFVHGYRNRPGSLVRKDTIPGGTSLLLVAVDLEADNTDCPQPDHYTPDQLVAIASGSVNSATNVTIKVDGVSLANLSNVLNTPYRVSSIFDYTALPTNNMIDAEFGLNCYQNSQGIPYTETNAAADGVVLMIPPLSPGSHTIAYTLTLTGTDTFTWSILEEVTVLPIVPTLAISQQNETLTLTWPQSATNYEVEATSGLNPPNWQPVNLPVTTAEGVFEVSAPLGDSARFFRLHQH